MKTIKVNLCGSQGCCPELEIKDDGNLTIKDDFGGNVKLTHKEFEDAIEHFKKFKKG